jgi:hypothetical protein
MLNFSDGSLSVNDAIIILKRLVGLDSGGKGIPFRVIAFDSRIGSFGNCAIPNVVYCFDGLKNIIKKDEESLCRCYFDHDLQGCKCDIRAFETIESFGVDESFFDKHIIIVCYRGFPDGGPYTLTSSITKNDDTITINSITKFSAAQIRAPVSQRTVMTINRAYLEGITRLSEFHDFEIDRCTDEYSCPCTYCDPHRVLNIVNDWLEYYGLERLFYR